MRPGPNENQMPFLYREIFDIVRQTRPAVSSPKGMIEGFRKRLGPLRAASNPMITIIIMGSKSICHNIFLPLLSFLDIQNDITYYPL
jgi:hypothetical protein